MSRSMNISCSHYGLVLREGKSFQGNSQACCIASALFALPTVLLNLSMIMVLLSKRFRSKPCETFLLNLAMTDIITGLIIMPTNFFVFSFMSQAKDPCTIANITSPIGHVLGIASFLTIVAVAVERYMNIFHPYLHGVKLRTFNVVIIITLIWIVSIALTMPSIFLQRGNVLRMAVFCVGLLGTLVNAFCYAKILWFAHKIRQEIAATAVRYGGPASSRKEKGERSLVTVGGLMILAIAICHAPVVSNNFLRLMGYGSVVLDFAFCWGWVLANGSALIDPLIMCSFNPDIRHHLLIFWRMKVCRRRQVERESEHTTGYKE